MDDYQCKFPQILTVRVNQKNHLCELENINGNRSKKKTMYTHNLLKNQSQFTQKPTNGTNFKNQQNLLKA